MTAKETASLTTKYEVLKKEVRMSNNQNVKDHEAINIRLDSITNKLDLALEGKADQTDVDIISNRLWWFIGIFALAFVGIIVTLIERHFK